METQVTARHFDLSPALREHVTKRLARLDRFYDGITDAHVILSSSGDAATGKTAEITVGVYRQRLSASSAASTHEKAVSDCVERLRRQVLKYKDKLKSKDQDRYR